MGTSDDLVSGLLSAIEQREATAREAAKYSSPKWETVSSAVVDLGGDDLDGLLPVPASPIGHLMVENDPESVLRLCRAHRTIIEHCVPDLDGSGGPNAAGLAKDVLQALAEGYGLKTEEDSA